MRKEYEMTQAQLDALMSACKSVPCIMIGGRAPRSPQENANAAWARLGLEMGFEHMTVQPVHNKSNRFFTAESTAMTKEQFAAMIAGREYCQEITKEECAIAKAAGLVVVFGASDDLMEFRGAINDELGAPGTAKVDSKGLLPDRESIEDDDVLEDFFARRKTAKTIEALWCKEPDYSWTFKTEIPHVCFEVVEGEDKYCRGIVFDSGKMS